MRDNNMATPGDSHEEENPIARWRGEGEGMKSGLTANEFAWGLLPVSPRTRGASDGGGQSPTAASGGSSRARSLPLLWSAEEVRAVSSRRLALPRRELRVRLLELFQGACAAALKCGGVTLFCLLAYGIAALWGCM